MSTKKEKATHGHRKPCGRVALPMPTIYDRASCLPDLPKEPTSMKNPANCHPDPNNVRDFLQQLKNRNPDEVLGSGARQGLGAALIQATIITAVTLVALTVGPLLYNQAAPAAKHTPEKDAKVAEPEAKTATPAPSPAPTVTPPATTKGTTSAEKDKDKDFLNKIGATETKKAPPKVNPLEKSADDLFKDLDKK
jgi:hypothetical protein